MVEYKIVNMVASASLGVEIDLFSLALNVENVEYEPEQFPGAILKVDNPPASLLVFKNGNLICTGNRSEEQIRRAIARAIEIIKEAQPHLALPDPNDVKYEVVNIVAAASLDVNVDLYSLAASSENVEYEPEQFPGAIIKLKKPKTTVLLFKNGKMICAGAKSEKDIEDSIKEVRKLIHDFIATRG